MPFVRIDALGLYPDAVSLVPQLLLALAPLLVQLLKRRADGPGAVAGRWKNDVLFLFGAMPG